MGFEINTDELTSSYGGKTAPSKTTDTHERVTPEHQKANDQEALGILKKQLADTLAKIASDTAAAANTKEPNYRQELEARIQSAKNNITSLEREIARAGGTPALADAATPASGAAPGFAINPGALKDAFATGAADDDKKPEFWTPERALTAAGAGAGAALAKPFAIEPGGVASTLAEKIYGAPEGSVAAIYNRQNPYTTSSLAREVAESYVPPANVPEAPPMGVEALDEAKTPGGKWGEKTGYGIGEGSVENASSKYQRSANKGPVSKRLNKMWGLQKPGEPTQLIDRILYRKQQAEAAEALKQQQMAEAQKLQEARELAMKKAQQARVEEVNRVAGQTTKAANTSQAINSALGRGINAVGGSLSALDLYRGLGSMFPEKETQDGRQFTPTTENVTQTTGGLGGVYALRNPEIGMPVLGGSQIVQAARDMARQKQATGENVSQAISGAGIAAMPWFPAAGTAMQIPSWYYILQQLAKENPDWLKSAVGVGSFDAQPGQ
jgi:hypothetical protein